MLQTVFADLLKMSLSASWVILGVWVVRLLLRKAPRVYSYALWLLVLARLLCPVFPEARFSSMPETAASGRVVQEFVESDIPVYITPNEPQREEVPDSLPQTEQVPQVNEAPVSQPAVVTLPQILAALWAAGAAAMVLYSLITLLLLKRKLRVSMPLRENIYLADHIDSPFVIGVFRPRIYLPSDMREAQSEHIILHEKHHIRRLDPAVKLLFYGALCLHWFNPLVWLAFYLMTQDMEMSCDEAVMKGMAEDIRLDYAASLLSLASPRRRFGAAPLAFGEGDPKRRIKNVLNYKKPAFWVSILAVAALVIAGVFFLTDPVGGNTNQLAYPGLEWNMTPEEVLRALDETDENISYEEVLPAEDGRTDYYYNFSLEDRESFGQPTEKIRFSFVDITGTGAYPGLYRVEVFYPDGENGVETDLSQVIEAVEGVYGEAADEYTENVYEDSTGTVVGWSETPLNGETFWNSEITADSFYSKEDQTLLYEGYSDEHPDIHLTEAEFAKLLDGRSMVRLYCFPDYSEKLIDREKRETSCFLCFDAISFVRTEQFLLKQSNNQGNTFLAGKLLFQNAALNWVPENGNHHGLIVVDDQRLRVAPEIVLTIAESEVWNRDQMLRFLTEGPNPLASERDAKKLLRKYPGERIEVRRFYSIPGDNEPDYTLVFFDGKLTWFATNDFLRVYEVEAVDMDPARIPGGLEYPGLNWGMTPQEVKDVLGLSDPSAYEEQVGPGDVSGLASTLTIKLTDREYFGIMASEVVLSFSDRNDDIKGFGLGSVVIRYDESVDLQSIHDSLTKVYGPESRENTWLPDESAADAMGEDVLRLLYYEVETPMSTYRDMSGSLEEFRQRLKEIYLVGLICKETDSGCSVGLYGGGLVSLQQWMEAVAS